MVSETPEDPTTAGVRHGPLTWGQQLIWLGYLASPPERRHGHTVAQKFALPRGASLPVISAALDTLVARHESLRTTFHLLDSGDTGDAVQVVHEPQPVPVESLTAPDATAAEALVHEHRSRMTQQAFDLARDGLVRAAVVMAGSQPAGLIVSTHHIAVDGWSWRVLHDEFDVLVRAAIDGVAPALPTVPWQPLDQAAFEGSEQGRKRNGAALRYWERQFAVMPDRVLPGTGGNGQPGQQIVVLDSPSLATAVSWLCRRYQVVDSTLLFAAFAAVLGIVTGRERSAVMTLSSNRLSERTRDLVASLVQYTVATLDLSGDPPFTELVRRAGAAMMTAYRYGQYDFQEMKALERDHARQRGLSFSQPAGLNFKRYSDEAIIDRADPGPPPVINRDGSSSRVLPVRGTCARGVILLSVQPAPESMQLELLGDGEAVAPDEMTRLVRALEAFLVEAVTRPELRLSQLPRLCDLSAPALGPDWALVDNCWVNLRDLERALLAHPSVTAAAAGKSDSDGSLLVSLTADDPAPTRESLHEQVLRAAESGLAVIAPHQYMVP